MRARQTYIPVLEHAVRMSASVNEHGNDSLSYTAVEPDSLIAVLWHVLSFSAFDCL